MANILVVDDNPVIQLMLSLMLKRNDQSVLTAASGQEALELIERTNVDLVILDVNMPDMDGLTLLKQLRDDERYQDLPIIMLTASGREQVRLVAKQKGANGFLTKPTSSRELLDMVARFTTNVTPPANNAASASQPIYDKVTGS
jgi:CheY-like chemotaxis protein